MPDWDRCANLVDTCLCDRITGLLAENPVLRTTIREMTFAHCALVPSIEEDLWMNPESGFWSLYREEPQGGFYRGAAVKLFLNTCTTVSMVIETLEFLGSRDASVIEISMLLLGVVCRLNRPEEWDEVEDVRNMARELAWGFCCAGQFDGIVALTRLRLMGSCIEWFTRADGYVAELVERSSWLMSNCGPHGPEENRVSYTIGVELMAVLMSIGHDFQEDWVWHLFTTYEFAIGDAGTVAIGEAIERWPVLAGRGGFDIVLGIVEMFLQSENSYGSIEAVQGLVETMAKRVQNGSMLSVEQVEKIVGMSFMIGSAYGIGVLRALMVVIMKGQGELIDRMFVEFLERMEKEVDSWDSYMPEVAVILVSYVRHHMEVAQTLIPDIKFRGILEKYAEREEHPEDWAFLVRIWTVFVQLELLPVDITRGIVVSLAERFAKRFPSSAGPAFVVMISDLYLSRFLVCDNFIWPELIKMWLDHLGYFSTDYLRAQSAAALLKMQSMGIPGVDYENRIGQLVRAEIPDVKLEGDYWGHVYDDTIEMPCETQWRALFSDFVLTKRE
jgi:hypothetical protein